MADDRRRMLLDQFGEPIPPGAIETLRAEISATSAIAGRPPFSGHLAFGMDPGRMGAVLRAADNGNTLEWMILAEEIEELFAHYGAVLGKRRRQVVQLPITVKAADGDTAAETTAFEIHANFVRDWIETDVLQDALFDVTDAIGKGFSVSEITWQTEPGCVRPEALLYRPPRFFELSWVDGSTVWLRDDAGFQPLTPHKFLVHRHPSKSGLIARSGLTRAVAFLFLYSSYTLKDWAIFCQGYGLPLRLGRYGPEASEDDKRVLWRAVASVAGDVAAIIPKSMEVEFVKGESHAAGTDLFLKRADWLNREVSKIVLGGTAGTDAIAGGHAVGKEHHQVEQDVERFDGRLLSTSCTRQLVQPMIAFTFGPQRAYPSIVIGQPEQVPLRDFIDAVTDLGPQGLRVRAQDVYDRLAIQAPSPEDDVVGGQAPQPVTVPPIPAPPVQLLDDASGHARRGALLTSLVARMAEKPPEVVERLSDRLQMDASGALAGMTEDVRRAFDQATSQQDLVHRLSTLQLPQEAFAHAMQQAMAVAYLLGQSELLDEIGADHLRSVRGH